MGERGEREGGRGEREREREAGKNRPNGGEEPLSPGDLYHRLRLLRSAHSSRTQDTWERMVDTPTIPGILKELQHATLGDNAKSILETSAQDGKVRL